MTSMDDLMSLLADAAWLAGWLKEVHPGTVASECAERHLGQIVELVDAEAKRINLELEWQSSAQSEEYLEGGKR